MEKRHSLFYISHLVHCAFLSVGSRVDKLEDQIMHLFDQNKAKWYVRHIKGGATVMRSLVEAEVTVNSKF